MSSSHRSDSSQVVATVNETTAEVRQCSSLDPDGDVVLKCQDRDTGTAISFRASSKVLLLTSPVYVRMFSSSFKEGQELLQGDCAVVELKDNDASSISLILNVLHY
ncbi:hypothetical protein AOQ84DRAFT_34754 [Glonium stellatum]|uniref:BTB domain-containing protein n=1 Tax=Glonium stellatum TaxID=574774 RepID=A0A8E2JTB3_9PEZI|nr:hypothetical protein AOQ84DRAFT_34754 [Glonium stellatum]